MKSTTFLQLNLLFIFVMLSPILNARNSASTTLNTTSEYILESMELSEKYFSFIWGKQTTTNLSWLYFGDKEVIGYRIQNLPDGLLLDSGTGVLTGVPTPVLDDNQGFLNNVFSPEITFEFSDGTSFSDILTFDIYNPYTIDFNLIDTNSNTTIRNISQNDVLDLTALEKKLNIEAFIINASNGRQALLTSDQQVIFKVNETIFRTESVAPYALAGDIGGQFLDWNATPGIYTISATIISKSTGKALISPWEVSFSIIENSPPSIENITGIIPDVWGQRTNLQVIANDPNGDSLTYTASGLPPGLNIDSITGKITGILPIDSTDGTSTGFDALITVKDEKGLEDSTALRFFIFDTYIDSLSLIDANTNTTIAEYENLTERRLHSIDLDIVGENFNLRLNTKIDPSYIKAVSFTIDGDLFRTERVAPYALAGDISGNYNSWTPSLGKHSINVDLVPGPRGFRLYYGPATFNLEIVDSSVSEDNTSEGISLFPNPASNSIQLNVTEGRSSYQIIDSLSSQIIMDGTVTPTGNHIDISSLKKGLYVISIEKDGTQNQMRLMKI